MEITNGQDGVDWNSDGDIGDPMEKFEQNNAKTMWMTPALDFVEFHCGDLVDAGGVMIELWGRDPADVAGHFWRQHELLLDEHSG